MLLFDENGYIHPHEIIEVSLTEFERVFIQSMENRDHRQLIFSGYLRFIKDLKSTLGVSFYQWVNGSFTTKKPFPGDIDVVSFIEYDRFISKLPQIEHFHAVSKNLYNTDAHFAAVCKWNHRFFDRSEQNQAYWKDVFGFSRPDENGIKHPKGILKIQF